MCVPCYRRSKAYFTKENKAQRDTAKQWQAARADAKQGGGGSLLYGVRHSLKLQKSQKVSKETFYVQCILFISQVR